MGEFIANNFEYIVVGIGVLIVIGIFDLNNNLKALGERVDKILVLMDTD